MIHKGERTWIRTWCMTKKMRGHSGRKFPQESRNSCRVMSRSCGCRDVDSVPKCAHHWNQPGNKNAQIVSFLSHIALICARLCMQLLQPLAQSLIPSLVANTEVLKVPRRKQAKSHRINSGWISLSEQWGKIQAPRFEY